MSLSDERLMRYFDGELDAEEAADVEQLLGASPEARAILADLERVRIVVRAAADAQGARGGDIASRVMAQLPPPGAVAAARLASGDATGGRVVPFARAVPAASAVGLALAAAAAVALLVRSHPAPPAVTTARVAESATAAVAVAAAAAPGPSASPEGEPAALTGEAETGASIESVDFGAHNGTIFMVASGLQVTPVVWLVDETARTGSRMKPL